jgi:hypothetical protein
VPHCSATLEQYVPAERISTLREIADQGSPILAGVALIPQDPVPAQPEDPDSPQLTCVAVQLGRTKTGVADEDRRVLLIGRRLMRF